MSKDAISKTRKSVLAKFDKAFKSAPFAVARFAFTERITECIDAFDGGAANEDEDLAAYAKGYAEDEFTFVKSWAEQCAGLLAIPVSAIIVSGWDYHHSLSFSTEVGVYEASDFAEDGDDPHAVEGVTIGTFKDDDSTVTLCKR